jgi:hypothetical protein
MDTSVCLIERITGAPTDADWRRLDELYATKSKPCPPLVSGEEHGAARGQDDGSWAGFSNRPGRIGNRVHAGLIGDGAPLSVKRVAPCLCAEKPTSLVLGHE